MDGLAEQLQSNNAKNWRVADRERVIVTCKR